MRHSTEILCQERAECGTAWKCCLLNQGKTEGDGIITLFLMEFFPKIHYIHIHPALKSETFFLMSFKT